MRAIALLFPACFAFATALHGQTQSIHYEMKLLRVYQNYPHNDAGGPDITWKARAIINGMGTSPIAGPTGQIHLPNMQSTGWFDAGAQTIASGTMTYTAANTFNLCSDNITVNMELEGWEDDCDNVFHFQNMCDGHRFGANANGVGNAKINPGSGVTRVFQLTNWPSNKFQNPYYGFEVSLTYTLTNGIREVIYAGNASGGPVADVCEGGHYFVYARTGPGFSGGDFEFQRSDNNGSTWTTVQTGPSPAYRVTASTNTNILYRVRLRGGFGCLGYANDDGWVTPAGAGNLRVIPTFGAADVNYSIQSSCEGLALSSITVSSINNLPAGISVTMQLNAPDDPFFVSPNPGLVSLPYTWQNLEPGRYRLNVTGVLLNGENLPTGQCTQDIFIQIPPVTLPVFTGLTVSPPGCGQTTGSVNATISTYNAGLVHSWQVFAVGNTTTPVATSNQQASSVQISNLAPGNYFVRLTLNGTCVVNSNPFSIAAPPAVADGTAQVVYPGASTTVLCPDGKTTVNFSVAAGTGQNSVRVYLATALNNPLVSGAASPGSPLSTQLIPGNYTAVFQRDDNGCQEFENFTILNTSNALLVSVVATTKPAACTPLGGTLTLSVTGGTPPYTFKINGVVRTPTSVTGNNRLFNQLPSGRGIYEVTDANGCNVGVQRFTVPAWVTGTPISEFRPYVWPQNVVDVLTCNGGNDGYFWYEPVSGTGPFQTRVAPLDASYGPAVPGTAAQIRENLPAGVYTVYMKDATNCEVAQVAYIEEFPAITITKVVLDPMYCGQMATTMRIYATGLLRRTIAGFTWQTGIHWSLNGPNGLWYGGSGLAEDPADPNGIIITMNNIVPQNYNIVIRQQKGTPFTIGGYGPAYAIECFSPVFALTPADFNVSTPVSVTAQVVSPTCNGETNGRITVNFVGGNPGYELQLVRFNSQMPHANPAVVATVVLSGNAPGSYTFNNLSAGSYGVRVRTAMVDGGATNLPGSCTSYFPGNWNTSFFTPYILTNPLPLSINTITTVTPLQCDLTGGQIRVLSVTGGTLPYRYSVNGEDFSTNNLLPALSQNTVYVRDANSCQTTQNYTVTAVINPSLSLSFAATPPANCVLQGLGTLTITPGTPPYRVEYSTSMSGGQLVNPIIIQTSSLSLPLSGLTPGSLFVKITDAAKCVKSFTFTVPSVSATPLGAATTSKTEQSCPGIHNGALTITAQGGTAPYQIVYNGVTTTGATRSLSNLGPGVYSFDITDAAGCSYTHEETIEAATAIRHTQSYTPVGPCTNSGNGSVTITPQGGQPPYTITWLDGAPSQVVGAGGSFTRSNLNREEYIFTITGAGAGCSLVSSILPPGPDVPFTAILGAVSQPQCAGVNNGSVTIQASGGSSPYTYSSNGGQSFQSSAIFAGLSAGTYSFIARDAAGCERTISNVQINNVQALSVNINTSPVSCFGGNNGSIAVTPSNGVSPYTLSVNGGTPSSNLTASNLAAGSYSVVVSDASGCLFSNPAVMVSQPDLLTLSATPTPPACFGGTGSIALSAMGGTGAYQYRLAGGTYSANNVLSNLAAGHYDVQARDANGCETSLLNVQVQEPSPIVIQLQDATPDYCNRSDGTATVSASGGTGGLTYSWSNGAAGTMVTGLAAGNVTVTAMDQNNCTNILTVNIPPVAGPSISSISVQDALCTNDNGTAMVNFSGGTGTISINWSNGGMGASLSGLSADSYTATVTDAVGCSASQTTAVGFVPAHTLSVDKSDENCDQSNGSITVHVSGGSGNFSYAWPSGVNATGNTASGLSGGVYVVTVTDNTRGCIVSVSVTLSNTPALSAELNVVNALCNGQASGSITAVPLTGTAPFTLSVNGGTPSSNLTAGGLASGVYAIVVSDVNGCTFSNPAVSVGEPPLLTLSATPAAPSCFGGQNGSITLLAGGGTGAYQYRLTGGTYSNNPVISNLSTGSYSVQVRDANGCETTLANVEVTQPSAVTIQLAGTTPEFCGRADGTATVSAAGGTGTISIQWSDNQSGPTATGLAQGSYSVTATDANGCTASLQGINISETPPVTVSIAELLHSLCDEGNGRITVSATNAPSPFTYTWSHNAGLNSPTADGLNAGPYTVTVTDGNQCSAQVSATVLLRPRPILSPPVVTLAACMGNTGSMQVSVQSGGTAPFVYAWSHNPSLNSGLASNLPTGSYTCTVTDFYGCTAVVTAFVGELPPPQATVSVTTATCSLPNGSAQVAVTGGTTPYQYAWSHGAPNSAQAANLAAGGYTVTVTDLYGCQDVRHFTVGNIPGPSALNVSFQNSVCLNATGSIAVTPQGGTTPFSYTWSHNPLLNQPTAQLLPGGVYAVTATDANGCTISATQVIQFLAPPAIQTVQQVNSLCVNGNGLIQVAVTGNGPFSYTWTAGVSTGPLAQNLNVGNYIVTVTDANNCTSTRNYTIALEPAPIVQLQNVTASRCGANDGSISLQISLGRSPFIYTWSHNATLNASTASGLAPGQYAVTVTDANGCTGQVSATVTELPPPSVFVTAVTSTCSLPNGSAQSFVSNGTAPYTYTWSSGSPDSPSAQNLPAGQYTLTVSDAFGCTGTQSFSVGDIPGPSALQVSFNHSVCVNFNGYIAVAPQGGTAPFHYAWSHNPFLNNSIASGLPAGTYAVTLTDATGCVISASQTIAFQPPPVVETVQQVNSLCANGNGVIEIAATGTGPFNYTWTNNVSNGPLAQNLNAGQYTVTVTDVNGCSMPRSFDIALEAAPDIQLVTQVNDICGQGIGYLRIRASGGRAPLVFSWSHAPGLNAGEAGGLTAGVYGVTVTDANGCTATGQYTITETPGPALAVVYIATAFCGNPVGSVSVQPSGGTAPYSYVWSHQPTLNSASAGNLLPGTYAVTVTDANGCTATTTAVVGSTSTPVLSLVSVNENPCVAQDGVITFAVQSGTPPYTYAWSHSLGLNSLSASNLSSGSYAITATDANGCQASSSASVTDRRGPVLQVANVTPSSCGFADGSATVSVSFGQAPFQFSWSHSAIVSGNTANGLAAGSYSVTVTDANACTDVISVNISDSQGPQASMSQINSAICTPNNGSMSVSVQMGTAPYVYSWSHAPALNSPEATGLAPGNYAVTVTDANGCRAIASGSVGFQAPPIAAATVNHAVCEPNTGSIAVSASGGLPPYTIAWNTPALNGFNPAPVFAGNYAATITDANGCQAFLPVVVSFFPGPQALLTQQQNPSCQQSNGSIQVGQIGGTPPYSYTWSHNPNLNFFAASSLPAGLYNVTITDANGCMATLTASLTDIPAATLSLIPTSSFCGQNSGSLTIAVTGGALPLSYAWSHNAALNQSTATGLAAGSYTVTVTEANGCQSSATAQVTDIAGVSASIASFANAVCVANTGAMVIAATGGNGPYSYVWSHSAGLNSPNASGLTAGLYTVTVTDANGCSSVVSQTLNFVPGPQLALATLTNAVCQDGNGALAFSVSGGTAPFAFQWSHNAGLNAAVATNLSAGPYGITITDANGCTASQVAQVAFIAGPQLSVAAQSDSYCNNQTGAISLAVLGGVGPMQFAWSHNTGLHASTAIGLSSGTYSATVTDANGCTASTSTVVADVPGFTVPAPLIHDANCLQADGAILLAPLGGQAPYEYAWSHDPDLNSPSAENLTAGLYQVTITDAGGCAQTLIIEVQTTDGPVPAVAQLQNASCGQANGSITTLLSGGQPPYTYAWSNGSTAASLSNLAGGIYQLTVTDANGCQGVLLATLTASTAPALQLLNMQPTGCTNAVGALQFGASGGQTPYAFAWSHDAGLNSAAALGLVGGVYTVTFTDATGCTATATAEVQVQTNLSLALVQTQSAICTSATGSATVAGAGGPAPYGFAWSHDAHLNSAHAENLAAGTYSVSVTDGAGCTAQLTLTVSAQNVPLSLSVLQSTDADCLQANGSVEVTASGGQGPYAYAWSHNATLNSSMASNLAAGTYAVTATDANGCLGELTVSISEAGAPVVSIQTTDAWCEQATGTATASSMDAFSYAWESASQPGMLIATTATATNLAAGVYRVTVTNQLGCSAVQTVHIQDLPGMVLNVSATPVLCFGQENGLANVTASGGTGPYQFVWSNNQTGASASGLGAGLYTVIATDANGCTAEGSVTVMQPQVLAVQLSAFVQPTCETSLNGALAVQTSGGVPPYTYRWSSGQQTSSIGGLAPGSYRLTVTDANGCQADFQTDLVAAGILDVTISTADVTCAGLNNGSATVTTPGVFTYQWSVPGTGSSVANLAPGSYSLTVSNAEGCIAVRNFVITAPPAVVLQVSSTPSCLNELNGTATAIAQGGTGGFSYTWSNGQTGTSVSNLLPGLLSVTATDANGCTRSQSVFISAAPFPTLSIVEITQPNCAGTTPGSATVLAAGGTGVITYQWNDPQGQVGPSAANLQAGAYTVTATDENGCRATLTVQVEPPADFLLNLGTVSHPACFGSANGSATAVVQGGSGQFSYLWNDPQGQSSPQAVNLTAGVYTVLVTDIQSGCTQIAIATLTNPALLQLSVASTTHVPCAGENRGSAAVNASGGTGSYSFSWNDPANQTSPAATGLLAGVYQVVVTDANGCTASTQVQITEPAPLSAQIDTIVAPRCFGQDNGAATVRAGGGTGSYAFRWNDPAMQATATATNLSPGSYTVTVQDANNCETSVLAIVPGTPQIVIEVTAQSNPVCAGDSNGSLGVSATGGTGALSFQWSSGQSGPLAPGLPAGTYTVSVTDANGCLERLTLQLLPAAGIVIQVLAATPPTCANKNTGRIAVAASGGSSAFSYEWSNGMQGAEITQLAGGQSYRVTATNTAGCSQAITVDLASGAVIDLSAIPNNAIVCADDVFALNLDAFAASRVSGPGGFSDTRRQVLLEAAGLYTIAVESQEGCRDTATLNLTVTANVLAAGMVLPSDVVVQDSVVVLETSWPAPDSVRWVFDPSWARLVRQEQNQYWFVFSTPGQYTLGMIARQGGCEDLISKAIVVHADSSSIPSASLGPLEIVRASVNPNPNAGLFQAVVELSRPQTLFVSLYKANGVLADRRRAEGLAQYSFDFDLRGQAGTYLLLIQTGRDRRTLTVLVLE